MRNFEPIKTKKQRRHDGDLMDTGRGRKKTQARGGKKKYYEDWN